jgi:hypothetical protein
MLFVFLFFRLVFKKSSNERLLSSFVLSSETMFQSVEQMASEIQTKNDVIKENNRFRVYYIDETY